MSEAEVQENLTCFYPADRAKIRPVATRHHEATGGSARAATAALDAAFLHDQDPYETLGRSMATASVERIAARASV